MNTIGRLFRVSIFGESHGNSVGVMIDGCPPGIDLLISDFENDLALRRGGLLRGTTRRMETDIPQIQSGVFNDKSTGSPINIYFENKNIISEDYDESKDIPRPSHADFVAIKKYNGFSDFRGGGHFSGRLTVGLVAAGVIAKKILKDIEIKTEILEIGGDKSQNLNGLEKAVEKNDSIGGIIECKVTNLPIGLGEPFFDSVESLISHAVFSIPSVKAIEFGSGFQSAKMFGSEHNDVLENFETGKTTTNNSGGVVGGISNGNDLIFRIAIKPTASTPQIQNSLNLKTNKMQDFHIKGRHDLCIALRIPIILEAVTAIVLADLVLIKNNYK